MKHVNEIKFEGNTPWEKAMNEASHYYIKSIDDSLTKEERDRNHNMWFDLKFAIELGLYGNNS